MKVLSIWQAKFVSNRYHFTRDIRLKVIDFGRTSIPSDLHYKLIERITGPHLFIKATKTKFYEGAEGVHQAVDILEATNPKFQYVTADGEHHVHLTDPTLISNHILTFINKYRSECMKGPKS